MNLPEYVQKRAVLTFLSREYLRVSAKSVYNLADIDIIMSVFKDIFEAPEKAETLSQATKSIDLKYLYFRKRNTDNILSFDLLESYQIGQILVILNKANMSFEDFLSFLNEEYGD